MNFNYFTVIERFTSNIPHTSDLSSIIISIFALLVSCLSLYFEHLKSFRPVVRTTGRFILGKNDNNPNQLAIIIPLNICNEGATNGSIVNIYVKLINTANNTGAVLIARHIIDDWNARSPIIPTLRGKECTLLKIMFTPFSFNAKLNISPATYFASIYIKTSRNPKKWLLADTLQIDVNQNDCDRINQTTSSNTAKNEVVLQDKITRNQELEFEEFERLINEH